MGEFFVFDTSSKALYCIDEVTCVFLNQCLDGRSIRDVKDAMIAEGTFDAAEVDHVAQEIALLAANGLFDIPNYALSEDDIDNALMQRYDDFGVSSIIMGMAESCNLACVYCYCGDRQKVYKRKMSKDTIRRTVDWMLENSGDNKELDLIFFGGEPLMNKAGIEYAIRYSERVGKRYGKIFRFRMTSNVTLIDDDTADFLSRNGVRVLVSHDGPRRIHDAQCPTVSGKGSFDMATAAAKRLIGRQKNVAARSTLIAPVADLKEMVDFYEQLGFSSVFWGPATNPEISPTPYDFSEEDFFDFYRQHEAMLPDMLSKLEHGEKVFYNFYLKYAERFNPFIKGKKMNVTNCGAAGRGCLYVNVDGEVYPCHHFYGMEAWSVGNVKKSNDFIDTDLLKGFWRRYHEIRKKCESCWAALICTGPCAAEQMTRTGTFCDSIRFCDAKCFNIERAGYFYHKQNMITRDCENEVVDSQYLQNKKVG